MQSLLRFVSPSRGQHRTSGEFKRCLSSIRVGVFSWPLASKADIGGEDSFFYSLDNPNPNPKRLFVGGVADGVGSSPQASLYANTLMESCKEFVKYNPTVIMDPQEILHGGWEARPELFNGAIDGSSTACLGVIETTSKNKLNFYCANLGDSGYRVIRNGTIIAKSTPQLHRRNAPFQLGPGADIPSDAVVTHVDLERGDLVALCTDGVFDNLYDTHIALVLHGDDAVREAVARWRKSQHGWKWYEKWFLGQVQSPLEEIENCVTLPADVRGSRHAGNASLTQRARTLCSHAVAIYRSGRCPTPFAEEAAVGVGGKMDDVTAMIIQVT